MSGNITSQTYHCLIHCFKIFSLPLLLLAGEKLFFSNFCLERSGNNGQLLNYRTDKFIHEPSVFERQTDVFHKLKKKWAIILCQGPHPWNSCSTRFIILVIVSLSVALSFLSQPALSPTSLNSAVRIYVVLIYVLCFQRQVEEPGGSLPGISGFNGTSELITVKGSFPSDSVCSFIRFTCQIWVLMYLQIVVCSSLLTV